MKLLGAVLSEQGQCFSVVIVKKHVVDCPLKSEKALKVLMHYFPDMPVILMGQDPRGRATYRGRKDIVQYLASTHSSKILWKEYTFN